jgi:hypothetical protein
MKRPCAAAAIVLLSAGLALAQSIGGASGPVGSGTTGPMNPNNPTSPTLLPGPSTGVTEGRERTRVPKEAGSRQQSQPPGFDRAGRQQSEDLKR